ncbi:MAG: type I methionyl aminopeptidase [Spirochaetales bacterium]|nr:type I methionyl aminopeptidase [Spirochaetales bacterium]
MINIKNREQQDGIRRSSDILSQVFEKIDTMITPGVSTMDVDRVVEETIRKAGGVPAFLNYDGFPASVCASVNEQVIHGIPNEKPLKEGDIVGCDIGVLLDGYYSDACKTFGVGPISPAAQKLMDVTKKSLDAAIAVCVPGNRIKDIGKAVTKVVEPHDYGIVYSFCGHGVGINLHEDPQIPNYYPSRGLNPRLKPGMVIAIEPMVNEGTADVDMLDDGWTVVTGDGLLSAHFEHTILIGDKGPQVLTSWRFG